MRSDIQFLGLKEALARPESAAVHLLPVPYEGGVSYGRGASLGPRAILEASQQVEFFDEDAGSEPCEMGICTLAPVTAETPEEMVRRVRQAVDAILQAGKYPVVVGGDHSVTIGAFQALSARRPDLGAIQLDAHADLRESYEGSALSHACVMARIRDLTGQTLQVGIRSISGEEARRASEGHCPLVTMRAFRSSTFHLAAALAAMPEEVYLTVDVDAFDGSVIRSTGTPEPGGFTWLEGVDLIRDIFQAKRVVGFDLVELAGPGDAFSAFSAARLLYKMIGFAGPQATA